MVAAIQGENELQEAFQVETADLRAIAAPRAAASSSRVRPGIQRLNGAISVLIVILLILAPIPFGSHRPAFAMIWSTYVGVVTLLFGAALLAMRAPPRIGLADVWPELALALLLYAWLALQVLPIGGWLPLPTAPFGDLAATRSISLDPGNSILVFIQFLTFGMLYLLTAQVAINRRRARRLMLALFVVVTAFAIYGLVALTQLGDTLLGIEKRAYQGFATGTFVNRNSFATFLAIGLVAGLGCTLQLLSERSSATLARLIPALAFYLVGIGFIAMTLLATGSRLGTASAVAGVVVLLVLALVAYRASLRPLLAGVGVVLLFALVGLVFFGTPLVERLILLPGVDENRAVIHSQIWAAIWQRPWTGYGAGSFATVFQALQQPPLSGAGIWENTHSTYLALWFEMGLVAGSIPLVIVAVAGARAMLAMRDPSSTAVSLAAMAGITVFAVHSILDFSAEIEANAFLFTVLIALGAAGRMNGKASISG